MPIKNRILTITVLIIFLTVSLFSYNFIIENIHHSCIGEECSICIQLEAVIKNILNFKFIVIMPFITVILCLFTQLYIIAGTSFSVKKTLISLKVELWN